MIPEYLLYLFNDSVYLFFPLWSRVLGLIFPLFLVRLVFMNDFHDGIGILWLMFWLISEKGLCFICISTLMTFSHQILGLLGFMVSVGFGGGYWFRILDWIGK